ncbi:hypothetical protein BDR22DRAFT_820988 [Usnea florida]
MNRQQANDTRLTLIYERKSFPATTKLWAMLMTVNMVSRSESSPRTFFQKRPRLDRSLREIAFAMTQRVCTSEVSETSSSSSYSLRAESILKSHRNEVDSILTPARTDHDKPRDAAIKVTVNFDDLTGSALPSPISAYKHITYNAFSVANVGGEVVKDLQTHIPPNAIVTDSEQQSSSGTPSLTVEEPYTSFGLTDFYFGCATHTDEAAANLATQCTITVAGFENPLDKQFTIFLSRPLSNKSTRKW